MTKSFESRIMNERIVDTRNYRYIVADCYDDRTQWAEIRRLPIDKLDTTAANDGWETVRRIEGND